MRINTNVAALNAWRNLSTSDDNMAKSLERLSSGLRISKAADDAAGLAISEKMKSQIGGLKMAQRNAQDGISLIQTAEGGLAESASILLRMRDLANQSTTGTLEGPDREKIGAEFDALKTELSRIADTTRFNNQLLLNGGLGGSISGVGTGLTAATGISNIQTLGAAAGNYTLAYNSTTKALSITNAAAQTDSITLSALPTGFDTATLTFSALNLSVTVNAQLTADIGTNNAFTVSAGAAEIQIGANGSTTVDVEIKDMSSDGLGLTASSVNTTDSAKAAVTLLDLAIGKVNTERSKLGALQNRLEHTIANLGNSIENLTSAESRIRDVDMAIEMSNFTKGQILQQAGTAMLAQANQRPQSVMQLLRG